MSRSEFNAERTLGFEYVRKWGIWFLVKKFADSEIKKEIGSRARRMPLVIKLPAEPSSFLPALYRTLAEHGLKAGRIDAFHTSPDKDLGGTERYRVEITIRRRCSKPSD